MCEHFFLRYRNYVLGILLLFFLSEGHAQNTVLESGIDKLTLKGCVIQNNGIEITGTGNYENNKAYVNSETTLDEIYLNYNLKILELSQAGEYKFCIGKNSNLAGTMVEFAGNLNTTTLNIHRVNYSQLIIAKSFTLPFKLILGKNYKIRIGKRIRHLVIEISSDIDYYLNDTLQYPTPFFGCFWGTPYLACLDGKVRIEEFILSTTFNKTPRLVVWGDSFIEGNALDNVENRYVSLIKNKIGFSNIAIMGKGGESSSSINTRFPKELSWFKEATYAILALGANDNDFLNWKTNILNQLNQLRKQNIIPIIMTITPRYDIVGRIPFMQQANAWIRNEYNGVYIDFNKAVTKDGEQWVDSLGMPDKVHPSVKGHLVMYNTIINEAPFLMRQEPSFHIDFINETTKEQISDTLVYSVKSNFTGVVRGINTPISLSPDSDYYFRGLTVNPQINIWSDVLLVPSRPVAPTKIVLDNTTGNFDWTISPLYPKISDYQFSIDSGKSWTLCTEKPVNISGQIEAGHIQICVRATESNFKSLPLKSTSRFSNIVGGVTLSSKNIHIYPNPVIDKIIIDNITERTSLIIYSAEGQILKAFSLIEYMNVINLEDLSNGLYILKLTNAHNNNVMKFLKK